LPGRSNGNPDRIIADLTCGQGYRASYMGKPKLSNAILWGASLDHGENDETGKSTTRQTVMKKDVDLPAIRERFRTIRAMTLGNPSLPILTKAHLLRTFFDLMFVNLILSCFFARTPWIHAGAGGLLAVDSGGSRLLLILATHKF
jgi:hypothetical protein